MQTQSSPRLARRVRRLERHAHRRFIRHLARQRSLQARTDLDDTAARAIGLLLRRVPRGEARDFVDSMPGELRSLLTPYLDRPEEPETFDRSRYLEKLAADLAVDTNEAELVAHAVFRAMNHHLPAFELDDVASNLPHDLQALWREPSERLAGRPRGTARLRTLQRRAAGQAYPPDHSALAGGAIMVGLAAFALLGRWWLRRHTLKRRRSPVTQLSRLFAILAVTVASVPVLAAGPVPVQGRAGQCPMGAGGWLGILLFWATSLALIAALISLTVFLVRRSKAKAT